MAEVRHVTGTAGLSTFSFSFVFSVVRCCFGGLGARDQEALLWQQGTAWLCGRELDGNRIRSRKEKHNTGCRHDPVGSTCDRIINQLFYRHILSTQNVNLQPPPHTDLSSVATSGGGGGVNGRMVRGRFFAPAPRRCHPSFHNLCRAVGGKHIFLELLASKAVFFDCLC